MKKYKSAMRRALHRFNYAKRLHCLNAVISAMDCMHGIRMVAMGDDQVSYEDFAKMVKIYDAMFNKMQEI